MIKLGDTLDQMSLLKLINLENKVLDVFKMDIEGGERGVIRDMDMNYFCKYIKQFVIETHSNMKFNELVKLEQCFMLFFRSTRFFLGDRFDTPTWHRTEFQQDSYLLNLSIFKNEINLAELMFVNGELYFLNINFL